jgi:hypothetical protein
MKNFKNTCMLLLLLTAINVGAQENNEAIPESDKISIGLGMGLDYGGFGGNILFYPAPKIGLFAGLGYPLAGVGYNVGVKFRLLTKKPSKVNAYLMGMYGYNSSIYIQDGKEYNKLFYGPTFGLGIDTRYNPKKVGYWTFAILIPVRGSDVDAYIDDLKNNHNVEFKNDLFPLGFSVGYRFVID